MAVIVDANGVSSIRNNKLMLSLKVMDSSSSSQSAAAEPMHINMFAYSAKDLPRISALGDILYLENAEV